MRKLFLLLLAVCSVFAHPAFAQNQAFPNAVHAKLNFIDYGTLAGEDMRLGQGFEFAYFRNIAPALNVGVPFKLGLVKLPGTVDNNTVTASADLQFRLENIKSTAMVVPFAMAGAGYIFEKDNPHAQFPFGAGLHLRLSPYAFLTLQGEFRKALVDNRDNIHVGLGYVYLLHRSEKKPVPPNAPLDTDRDGTPDALDLCPTVPGPPSALGCPDADGDGIGDAEDQCPNEVGPLETNGCPDYDGDGFADKDDECPTVAGTWYGCPDSDFDGVPDKDDKCPNEKGPASNKGCPEKKDSDGDGFPDDVDLCPDKPGANQGCPDSDGDGIADNFDQCPDVPGTVRNNGCPEEKDSDGDGVPDSTDPCPTKAGNFGGCPDSDGDGIADHLDKCPNVPGPARNNGCPEEKDSDGDGVPDSLDPCPNKAGTFGGCPDTDGDGVPDNLDKCPDTPGAPNNAGCPEVKQEVKEKLATAARAVQFESGKAVLKNESYAVLDQVVAIMRENPAYTLSVSGHTDDVGDDERNLRLSQDRAKACYDYLVFRGIKKERIRYAGFGETRPIASNDTAEGRELNRRVEFELVLE